jgi:hypothetical protein
MKTPKTKSRDKTHASDAAAIRRHEKALSDHDIPLAGRSYNQKPVRKAKAAPKPIINRGGRPPKAKGTTADSCLNMRIAKGRREHWHQWCTDDGTTLSKLIIELVDKQTGYIEPKP